MMQLCPRKNASRASLNRSDDRVQSSWRCCEWATHEDIHFADIDKLAEELISEDTVVRRSCVLMRR